MAAKGTLAKQLVEEKIQKAFGEDFVGIADKKIYVWANDGGEKVQIAISLTCPKVPFAGTEVSGDYDFSNMSVEQATAEAQNARPQVEITEEEKANVAALMKRLGL